MRVTVERPVILVVFRVECSFVWEEQQVISMYSTSKAAALRKLKQLYMNGHANSPNQIKIKNVEFV